MLRISDLSAKLKHFDQPLYLCLAGYNHEEPVTTAILSTVHVHILPQFNIQGAAVAVPGDCTGQMYTGSKFNKLLSHQVSYVCLNMVAC